LWRKARRVYSLASRLPGTNRLGFQPSMALSVSISNGAIVSPARGLAPNIVTAITINARNGIAWSRVCFIIRCNLLAV
ncbi:MAG: hypothetical protein KZQ84_17050, partial [Candidatus Thiodiazotropha sp. (ex Lucinoma borealis)]|nr:hypothetical protein [Candidatus Thiodiazotropha sp. (ex Lucinoma borealis)]